MSLAVVKASLWRSVDRKRAVYDALTYAAYRYPASQPFSVTTDRFRPQGSTIVEAGDEVFIAASSQHIPCRNEELQRLESPITHHAGRRG